MTYRFHDMSVGILTRESVRRALQVGITAAQIISFLRGNAHPQCIATGGPLNCVRDFSVREGILLWADSDKKLVIVSEEGHEKVRDWWKANRAAM
ncbi:unnamed protein product [Nippostrongylus brasiliensis]|uniref:General transcription factor IIH subunit 4 n=1 Tax=Nippostrongylus brasiliensis TaxID=27835 RepID=A0A0N4Y7Z0_NIPBR|nr:unnamed protein product [Nippostrongylus brasiliensis]